MDSGTTRGLTLRNARIDGEIRALRISGSRIATADQASAEDLSVDLQGDRVLPGLINAHDHLQLNSLARLKYRDTYCNVGDWIEDVAAHLGTDGELGRLSAVSRDERLLMGGIKNLLSGATTVAHHDPLYAFLLGESYPVRVVTSYGWSHSLSIDGEDAVRRSHRQTPQDHPWIIHAAEGLDERARAEFERLEALGCIGANTLLVHAIALDPSQHARWAAAGAGLIWCPTSNVYLFGQSADVRHLAARGRVALGSDSRLSGGRDLLAELRFARELGASDERTLEACVTSAGAKLLKLTDRGSLQPGALADILILPPSMPLSDASRSDIRAVFIGGIMRYGDSDYMQLLRPADQWVEVGVDGRAKALDAVLAAWLSRASIREPGLELDAVSWKAA